MLTYMSIGWIMFWKAFILALWAAFKEHREKKKAEAVDVELLARFNDEWNRRSAKQPLMLTDRRTDVL